MPQSIVLATDPAIYFLCMLCQRKWSWVIYRTTTTQQPCLVKKQQDLQINQNFPIPVLLQNKVSDRNCRSSWNKKGEFHGMCELICIVIAMTCILLCRGHQWNVFILTLNTLRPLMTKEIPYVLLAVMFEWSRIFWWLEDSDDQQIPNSWTSSWSKFC